MNDNNQKNQNQGGNRQDQGSKDNVTAVLVGIDAAA